MKKAVKISVSLEEAIYHGYTFGETWNGFECPYFEKAEADRMVADFRIAGWPEQSIGRYNAVTDAYEFTSDGETDTYEAEIIQTEDGEKKVYPLGAYCWVWQRVEHNPLSPLCDELGKWCMMNNLPPASADELINEDITQEQREYLQDYIKRWDAAALIYDLSKEFAGVLREWLTPEQFTEMVALNDAETNKLVCHSHDHCDANQAALDAYKRLTGEDPETKVDTPQWEPMTEIIAQAWNIAKANRFYIDNK